MKHQKGFSNIVLILVLIALVGIAGYFIGKNKITTEPVTTPITQTSTTYTYKNHGFTIELPTGFIPHEEQSEGGPAISITLPTGGVSYVTDASWWEKYNIAPSYAYTKDQKIGETTFKVYSYGGINFYWFKKGNIGFEFRADDADKTKLEDLLKTFKFVGWPQN